MGAYLQMGHDSENLVGIPGLETFEGIVLSPVNRNPDELTNDVSRFRNIGSYDILFDPQLYYPRSERGQLSTHKYYPSDMDSADLTSESWWSRVVDDLVSEVTYCKVDAVCAPVVIPRRWDSEYFDRCNLLFRLLAGRVGSDSIQPIFTLCVNLDDLSDINQALRVASIVSSSGATNYYLVVQSDVEPRREIMDASSICGVMVLIGALQRAGNTVLVSNCSSDMILWKAAGAQSCASGKFFNLRRFTKSRFQEPEAGGGQLAYWFEHSLFAFLRQADLLRLQKRGLGHLISATQSTNLWASQILQQFAASPGTAWLGLSWREYLCWFGQTEGRISPADGTTIVEDWLVSAERNWETLENSRILFDERRNDGRWIRPWRQALNDFQQVSLS